MYKLIFSLYIQNKVYFLFCQGVFYPIAIYYKNSFISYNNFVTVIILPAEKERRSQIKV